jgi:hypothetical protein
MGFLDWLRLRQQPRVLEAKSPTPKEELQAVEPLGYGNEVDPLDKADRKNPTAVINAALRTAQERGRTARYTDFVAMDAGDIAAMLDAVVDAALTFEDVSTGRGFKVESSDKGVDELLNRAKKQADLEQLVEEVARDILKYGDGFVEPLFAGPELVGAQTYKPQEIFVARDDKGMLAKGKDDDGFPVAFQQKRQGRTVAGWQPWEMVHFKFWPSRKLAYSEKSLLDSLRLDWRKLQLVEQGMVVARVTRAYPRRVHYVDVTGKDRQAQEETLKSYIRRMTQRVLGRKQTNDGGLPVVDVSDDLFITTGYDPGPDGKPYPKLNKTEIEDPATAGLSELADVNYLRQKIWSQVPSDVVGIKRNTTTDLDTQDIAYTRLLRRLQRQLEKGLRGIFDQVLLANGRLPSQVEYRITLPTIDVKGSWKYSDARFRASMTIRNVLEMGMTSRRWAMRQMYNLSDQEIDLIWKEIQDEMTNPIFQAMVAPARDGLPSVSGEINGNVNKAGNDGGKPAPTAQKTAQTGQGVTKNGIDRTTDLGQRNRGNLSGG